MASSDFSRNIQLHTVRERAFFPQNLINKITLRYNFVIKHCINKSIPDFRPVTGFASKDRVEKSKIYKCV